MSATANLQIAEIGISGSNIRPELPLLDPTLGPPMVDVRSLHKDTGYFTYDPGLGETGICRSTITYVDGDNGVLLYRGYPIDTLVESCSYLEICWLLLNGELPTAAQLDRFTYDITHHTMVDEQLHAIYRGFRRDAHPMAVMCGVVGALAAFYHDGLDIFDPHHRLIASHRLNDDTPLPSPLPAVARGKLNTGSGSQFLGDRGLGCRRIHGHGASGKPWSTIVDRDDTGPDRLSLGIRVGIGGADCRLDDELLLPVCWSPAAVGGVSAIMGGFGAKNPRNRDPAPHR
jgi:hypothetical protein